MPACWERGLPPIAEESPERNPPPEDSVAAVAGMWVYVTAVFPYGGFNPTLIAWGVAEGLLAWTALVVAARLSERAAVP